MKKAIVLLLALAVVGVSAFAVDAPAPQTYTITGDATTSWFYNLTDSVSGFSNGTNIQFTYTFISGAAAGKKADSGTYGQIDITGIGLKTQDIKATGDLTPTFGTTSMSLSAKIVSGPLSVSIGSNPSAGYNNAPRVPLFSKDAGYVDADSLKASVSGDAGVKVTYSLGTLGSVAVSVASVNKVAGVAAVTAVPAVAAAAATYTLVTPAAAVTVPATPAVSTTYFQVAAGPTVGAAYAGGAIIAAGTAYYLFTPAVTAVPAVAAVTAVTAKTNHYLGGVDLSLTPVTGLTIVAGAWYDPDTKALAATGDVVAAFGDLSANAGADIYKLDTGALKYDIGGGLAYSLFAKKDSINADFYLANKDALAGHSLDLGLKFVDAGGLVAPLSFTLGFFADDLIASPANDPQKMSIAASGSYKVAISDTTSITPNAAFKMDMSGAKLSYMKIGADAALIANTTLSAYYEAGATQNDKNTNLVKADKPAKITISAKVSL